MQVALSVFNSDWSAVTLVANDRQMYVANAKGSKVQRCCLRDSSISSWYKAANTHGQRRACIAIMRPSAPKSTEYRKCSHRPAALRVRVQMFEKNKNIWAVQASAAGNSVPWMQAHCGHVLVPAHHEVFVVDDLHLDARCDVCWLV